jgi:hypothetical protein
MWEVLDDLESQESGGGGIVGKIDFAIGYKCFVSGATNEESFFAFDPTNEKSKAKALEAAKAFNDDHGGGGRPQVSVQFRVFKADVIGREVNWKGDRFFVYPVWTSSYKEVVKPAMKAAGITKTGTLWGRIGFSPEPSGRQEVKQDGSLGPEMVAHVTEVFKTQADAQKAAGSTSASGAPAASKGNGGSADCPDGWEAETWEAIKPEIAADIATRLGGDKSAGNLAKTLAAVAKDYGVPMTFVKPLAG